MPSGSGNLRLSVVLVPVKLFTATEEQRVSFRMIQEPSGKPVRYSGVRDGDIAVSVSNLSFEMVPETSQLVAAPVAVACKSLISKAWERFL